MTRRECRLSRPVATTIAALATVASSFSIALAARSHSTRAPQVRSGHGPGGAPRGIAYTVTPVTRGGAIEGRVRWSGAPPSPPSAPAVATGPGCESAPRLARIEVDPGSQGVADVVVYLADIARGAPPPRTETTVDNSRCNFSPWVAVTTLGAPLRFRNSDPGVFHNVRVIYGLAGSDTAFNLGLPSGLSVQRSIDREGIHRMVCDLHPAMGGFVHAFDHPYFAVTARDGRFRLRNVPAGRYVLRAWHAGWTPAGVAQGRPAWSPPVEGERGVDVSASAAQPVVADFDMSAEPRIMPRRSGTP